MTIVANDSITVSNVNDGTITHTAYSKSMDGTGGFTTVYPNLNLLDGTKDFSGGWSSAGKWVNDGTYQGLTVKKRTDIWFPICKTFTAPKDGVYTFSAYVKSSGNSANVKRYTDKNGTVYWDSGAHKIFENNFDWLRDNFTVTLKTGDTILVRYEITGTGTDSILWTAGHKWESGSTSTPYMPSDSEVTANDYPNYRGEYSDISSEQSTNPLDYTWTLARGNDGISPINLVIESSNGYQFKNNVINTTFTAILYQDNKEIDSDGTKFAYVWSKTKSDGTADTAWNLAHQSSQKTITITNSDVWQRATFNCTAEPLN